MASFRFPASSILQSSAQNTTTEVLKNLSPSAQVEIVSDWIKQAYPRFVIPMPPTTIDFCQIWLKALGCHFAVSIIEFERLDEAKSLLDEAKSLLDEAKSLLDEAKSLERLDEAKSLERLDEAKSLLDEAKSLLDEAKSGLKPKSDDNMCFSSSSFAIAFVHLNKSNGKDVDKHIEEYVECRGGGSYTIQHGEESYTISLKTLLEFLRSPSTV
jgi:hypothetical protein